MKNIDRLIGLYRDDARTDTIIQASMPRRQHVYNSKERLVHRMPLSSPERTSPRPVPSCGLPTTKRKPLICKTTCLTC
ncbi:MAG: hypothetical protein R2825_20430 [Saprospiraceae bacterium]